METYTEEAEINIEEISRKDMAKIKASAEILAEAISLPKQYKPYFLQFKAAASGLGVSLEPVVLPLKFPGKDSFALVFQKNGKDLGEDEAYEVFLKIRRKLKARNQNTFDWKGRVYMRWPAVPMKWPPSSEGREVFEILGYYEGRAYYIMNVRR
jgi:hypothetical protein